MSSSSQTKFEFYTDYVFGIAADVLLRDEPPTKASLRGLTR